MKSSWRKLLSSISASRSGNVTVIFAFSALPLLFAVGMGVDYTQAARRRDKLNAVADAAALSTVTPSMMASSPSYAHDWAVTMFKAQAARIGNTTLTSGSPNIQVTDTPTDQGTTRTTTVTYSAASTNFFPAVLSSQTITIGGKASSSGVALPNVDFYMMLDTSPSMALPATTDGINSMRTLTGGCSFACHQYSPSYDSNNRGGVDNYAVARAHSIDLRIDRVQSAVQDLMTSAQQTALASKAKYRVGIFDFDYQLTTVTPLSGNLSYVQQQASNIQLLEVDHNQWLTATNNNNNIDSAWETAMSGMNSKMGTPGNGTNAPSDSPQEVLFIVTDGVAHQSVGGTPTVMSMGDVKGSTWCNDIKARNIKIAIIYTTYNPIPWNDTYVAKVQPFQGNIPTTLGLCATKDLFTQVDTDGDITGAMNKLFQKIVGTAHLTH